MKAKPISAFQLSLLALVCAMVAGCGGGSGSSPAASGSAAGSGSSSSGAATTGTVTPPVIVIPPLTPVIATTVVATVGNDSTIIDETATSEAADSAGNIYVPDVNQQLVWKVTPSGTASVYVGSAADATLSYSLGAPQGVAVDHADNLYIGTLDGIVKVSPSGAISKPYLNADIYAPVPGNDANSGEAAFPAAQFAFDTSGNLYVTVPCSGIVRKITPSGAAITLASGLGMLTSETQIPDEGATITSCTGGANGIAVDALGNVYAADTLNQRILKITPSGTVSTFAGAAGIAGSADGSGAMATFYAPSNLTTDLAGNVYVSDSNGIRRITPQGMVKTLVGIANGNAPVLLPNSAAPAEFGAQAPIVVGSSLYVTATYSTFGWALVRFDGLQ